MDLATLVGDGLLATATVGAAYVGRQAQKARRKLDENAQKLDSLRDAQLIRHIHATVVEVLASDEGYALREQFHRFMYGISSTADE